MKGSRVRFLQPAPYIGLVWGRSSIWESNSFARRRLSVQVRSLPPPNQCRVSTAVVQRFCKPKVGSSILSPGTISSPHAFPLEWTRMPSDSESVERLTGHMLVRFQSGPPTRNGFACDFNFALSYRDSGLLRPWIAQRKSARRCAWLVGVVDDRRLAGADVLYIFRFRFDHVAQLAVR